MSANSGWKAVWQVNAAFLRAAAGLALAWITWRAGGHPGYDIFTLFAAIFAVVGLKHAVIAIAGLARLIWSRRKWARYRAQGADPKADRLADDADLKRRGLFR